MTERCFVGMTEDELKVWQELIVAWNLFCNLKDEHPDHVADFRRAIHECQRILAIRAMKRLTENAELIYVPPEIPRKIESPRIYDEYNRPPTQKEERKGQDALDLLQKLAKGL